VEQCVDTDLCGNYLNHVHVVVFLQILTSAPKAPTRVPVDLVCLPLDAPIPVRIPPALSPVPAQLDSYWTLISSPVLVSDICIIVIKTYMICMDLCKGFSIWKGFSNRKTSNWCLNMALNKH
jgi:hypothetical protein